MQNQTSIIRFEQSLENYENLYFKVFEFKEDFINQIITNSELVQNYYNKSEKIGGFYKSFLDIEKNRQHLRESISIINKFHYLKSLMFKKFRYFINKKSFYSAESGENI